MACGYRWAVGRSAGYSGPLPPSGFPDILLGTCRRFSLDDQPQYTCNIEYLITSITNSGYQPQTLEEEAGASGEEAMQESRFETIPASVPYRSPRETERVRMQGIQTAAVVGPSGEEIYTDKHGRVKVQFHWYRQGKRDEKNISY